MKTLPLFYYPSTWLWVDDDQTLLTSMSQTFDKYNAVLTFTEPKKCVEFLANYQAPSLKYSFLQASTHDEYYGVMQKTPMDFDIRSILNMLNDPTRYSEVTAMVIDYKMPEMNGFELAKLTSHLSIPKILLTGNTEENNAIDGFNENLIDRFIQKSESSMVPKLNKYLEKITIEYFQKISFPLVKYLEAEEKLPLSDPSFIDFFEAYCKDHNIREYYLINKYGTYLCVDQNEKQSCLIVHTMHSLENWLSMHGEEKKITPSDLKLVSEGKMIPFFGITTEPWEVTTSDWSPYLHRSCVLEGREKYFFSTVELD